MFFRLGLTIVGLPVAIYCLSLCIWSWLRRRLLITQTGWTDIPLLGKGRQEAGKIKGTVVVCGGSIGGLLTARICHDHFERVIIVEPEAWLSTSDGRETQAWTQKYQRYRVVQYYSLQAVQVFLFTALKAIFPNFEDECIASGIR
ncbi:hypothetical protein SERLADRAFT_372527 [Serpula lacrymans var. lacrymans S7.9]|uniref:Uncharacterized protein n=1 Tax=Serpula lacrymans var. lacrymans (strain S7.9) TaxID=578457 RepID=F8P5J4_SERL9|nr:uncharacterized protein SERLADRAFT_372527 [Serpula lacrymans var. lacrymans S7.9]EGO21881.1 hypothetical protein SERLADRAFT_372527 [Serpula lacrymans var. lacrymans S7.9]